MGPLHHPSHRRPTIHWHAVHMALKKRGFSLLREEDGGRKHIYRAPDDRVRLCACGAEDHEPTAESLSLASIGMIYPTHMNCWRENPKKKPCADS